MIEEGELLARRLLCVAFRLVYPTAGRGIDCIGGFIALLTSQLFLFSIVLAVGRSVDFRLMLLAPLIFAGLLESRRNIHAMAAVTALLYSGAALLWGDALSAVLASVNFILSLVVCLLIAEISRFSVKTIERVSRLALTLEEERQKLRDQIALLQGKQARLSDRGLAAFDEMSLAASRRSPQSSISTPSGSPF